MSDLRKWMNLVVSDSLMESGKYSQGYSYGDANTTSDLGAVRQNKSKSLFSLDDMLVAWNNANQPNTKEELIDFLKSLEFTDDVIDKIFDNGLDDKQLKAIEQIVKYATEFDLVNEALAFAEEELQSMTANSGGLTA